MKLLLPALSLSCAALFIGCSQTSEKANSDADHAVPASTMGVSDGLIPAKFATEATPTITQPTVEVAPASPKKTTVASPEPIEVVSSGEIPKKQQNRFNKKDANGDGQLDKEEIVDAFKAHYQRKELDKDPEAGAEKYLKKHDENGDGTLTAEEIYGN
ncbi:MULTISPECIES: EF-hand domain-containing protein [unclassified Lentimonas]|uniref:EF-hand domain-containing protein n=1 Tax=unclassified Lentimonas TaxID=2630993 RepID=UPI00132B80C0|nr:MULTISPECIES: EF-hand domain-containing protein [unclassified Lentimonas]CAA6691235.1 Unannotated [Lentimonas sp. CC19]CAA6694831.1 Unannotated [Lentimonas sp. CC10]CAA7071613.1 Unannotated [Lentimonas sp. CC11]